MPQPTATLLLLAYKQEPYIREAVRSALAQDYSPLEIVISDDCSPDGTFEIIKEEVAGYAGPHTVVINRNAERLGPRHRHAIRDKGHGTYTVRASGDDISYPHRVARQIALAERNGASLVTCNADAIDAEGRRIGLTATTRESRAITLEELAEHGWRPELLGATFAIHRRLDDLFPPFEPEQVYQMQDHVLPIRAQLLDSVWYESEPLLAFRFHPDSMSNRHADRTGDPAIYRETLSAHELGSPVMMLAELTRFMRGRPADPRLRHVRRVLEGRVVEKAFNLVVQRNRLRIGGLRPTWIPESEYFAREVSEQLTMRPAVREPR